MAKFFQYYNSTINDWDEAESFESSEFIDASAGAGSASKPIILNESGLLSSSFINDAGIDHGSIGGLSDDDHSIYILVNGGRSFSGSQSMGGYKLTNMANGTVNTDAVNLGQLNAAITGLQDFRESVIDKDLLTPPAGPTSGDRYLIGTDPDATATGDWATHEGEITEWNGSAWVFEDQPDHGTYVFIEDESTAYIFNNNTFASGDWVKFNSGTYTGSLGIELSANDFRLNLLSGGGLKLTGNEVGLEPNDIAGSGLVDDGSDNLAVDWATTFTIDGADGKALKASDLASTTASKGASVIGINDTGSYFDGDDVEAALQEIGSDLAGGIGGIEYTAATAIAKGDLVYISANNSVSKYSTITGYQAAIGIANVAANIGETVKVLANDTIITGVTTGATAGTKYFWTGTAWSATPSYTTGQHRWQGGVAKNATDVHVEVQYLGVKRS